jgi:hypothetical protein
MPQALTTMATIKCPHQGLGTTFSPRVVIADNGGAVAAEGDGGTLACPFVQLPCGGYTLRSLGLNSTTILGRRLILATDFQTSMTGLPLQIVETTQFIDDSSPSPLPADGSDPAADPAMLDLAPPVVVAAPTAGAFNTTTQLPTVLPIVFTLTSAFPRLWRLTLLNTVAATSIDLTSGVPGAAVVPPGPSWSTPTLAVTLQLTAVFLTALGPGAHHLFCTGVSQRGLSSYAQVVVTVA